MMKRTVFDFFSLFLSLSEVTRANLTQSWATQLGRKSHHVGSYDMLPALVLPGE